MKDTIIAKSLKDSSLLIKYVIQANASKTKWSWENSWYDISYTLCRLIRKNVSWQRIGHSRQSTTQSWADFHFILWIVLKHESILRILLKDFMHKIICQLMLVNIDEYKSIVTYWKALVIKWHNEMVIKTVMELHNLAILVLKTFQRILRNLTNNKNITTNIFRIQTFNSKICDIFVFNLLILHSKPKVWLILQNKNMAKNFCIIFWNKIRASLVHMSVTPSKFIFN